MTMNRQAKALLHPTLFLGGRKLMLENLIIANRAGQGNDIGQAVAVSAHCGETNWNSLPPSRRTPAQRGKYIIDLLAAWGLIVLEFGNIAGIMRDSAVESFEPHIFLGELLYNSDSNLGVHSIGVKLQGGHEGLR